MPPYWLMMSCRSCGTEDEPCITRWVFGQLLWISSMTFIARIFAVGLAGELVGAVEVPMAMASASTLVSATNFTASSGSVSSWSCVSLPSAPWPSSFSPSPVSSEPSTPSSPSTEMPPRWAISTTLLGDADIVVAVARGLAVGLERAVHHHRGEAGLDRGHAGGGLVAVVVMHADRDMRIDLGDGVHHVLEHDVVGIGARAARGLDDHRRIASLAAAMIASACSMLLMLKAGTP